MLEAICGGCVNWAVSVSGIGESTHARHFEGEALVAEEVRVW